jgi:hypothetical protein
MDSNLKYKSIEYWNERYKGEEHFEWFGEYEKYKQVIGKKLKNSDRILVLGKFVIWYICHMVHDRPNLFYDIFKDAATAK